MFYRLKLFEKGNILFIKKSEKSVHHCIVAISLEAEEENKVGFSSFSIIFSEPDFLLNEN